MTQRNCIAPDGTLLNYVTLGSAGPDLVLVHGWSCDLEHWREQWSLADQVRLVAVDLAGHGASGHDRVRYSITALARDVIAVMDAERIDKGILVGHSMGGLVITEVAALAPERTVGLIPVDTLQNVEQLFPPGALPALLSALRADFATALRAFLESLFVPDTDPALLEWVITRALAGNPASLLAILDAASRHDLLATLARVTAPVHSINSDMKPTEGSAARRHLASFDVEVLPGLGHFPQLEDPGSFNACLQRIVSNWHDR